MLVFVLSRVFVCLWWPDMVPNQRQLFIVVSDWGSYLGSHFPFVFVGSCSMFSCLSALFILASWFVLLLVYSVFILLIN